MLLTRLWSRLAGTGKFGTKLDSASSSFISMEALVFPYEKVTA